MCLTAEASNLPLSDLLNRSLKKREAAKNVPFVLSLRARLNPSGRHNESKQRSALFLCFLLLCLLTMEELLGVGLPASSCGRSN